MPELNDELVSEVFETKAEKAVALLKDVQDNAIAAVDQRVADTMAEFGIRKPKRRRRPVEKQLALLDCIFKNNGVNPLTGEKLGFQDMINLDKELLTRIAANPKLRADYEDTQFHQEQPLLFPRVVTQQVREAVEPELNLTPLMQVIRYTNSSQLVFPAVSAMSAGDLRIGEGKEYPEGKLQWAGQVAVTIGKHGIKVSATEEMVRYSLWDLWAMNLRAAGRALARHKERQSKTQVLDQGSVYYDNGTAGERHTTGRDDSGGFNGTFTVWDLFDMAADLIQEGYVPDTIIMHPFAWPIFALDPVMRQMGFMHNGKILSGYQGQPGNGSVFDPGGLLQQRALSEPANRATTYSSVPSQYPFGPMRIIVSPFVSYNRTNQATDIYVCDSRDLGILVVDEDVVTDEWKDPERDIRNVKFRERYSFASANNGAAIRIARDVVVDRSYHFEGGMLTADVTLDTSEFTVS